MRETQSRSRSINLRANLASTSGPALCLSDGPAHRTVFIPLCVRSTHSPGDSASRRGVRVDHPHKVAAPVREKCLRIFVARGTRRTWTGKHGSQPAKGSWHEAGDEGHSDL